MADKKQGQTSGQSQPTNVPVGRSPGQQMQPQERGREGATSGAMQRGRAQPMAGPGYSRGGPSPFSLMRRMMEDMDRLFEDFGFGGFGRMGRLGLAPLEEELAALGPAQSFGALTQPMMQAMWSPQIEVSQQGDRLLVRADLPGMNKDDVRVNLTDEGLVIEGERRQEREETRGGIMHSERSYGSFVRSIPLPPGVDPNSCDASFQDGVLEISLKMPEPQGRRIEVRTGPSAGAQQQPEQQQGFAPEGQENGTQAPPARH